MKATAVRRLSAAVAAAVLAVALQPAGVRQAEATLAARAGRVRLRVAVSTKWTTISRFKSDQTVFAAFDPKARPVRAFCCALRVVTNDQSTAFRRDMSMPGADQLRCWP
jgi:hypothetical protein